MIISILLIIGGVIIMYTTLSHCDCDTCWHRDLAYRRLAQFGLILCFVGILINAYCFWYWGL